MYSSEAGLAGPESCLASRFFLGGELLFCVKNIARIYELESATTTNPPWKNHLVPSCLSFSF